ncbi:hypothetical protein P0082_03915 [Candidatus Haliotispira prima]|uniref:DUF1795 domain-containing protein n=1 Tax=Candidatus Haliotispira prima TaxID=3034016 RepID=A0ABY8MKA1_9SPIO|nr:hypothetical protein P0082_03915 [Candidatus Haliotispira prima]
MKKGSNVMRMLKLIGILAVITSLAACGRKIETGTSDSWKSLTENDYSISYPEDWELDQSGQTGTSFILLSPLSSGEDRFTESVNLIIQDWTGRNLDLDGYVELSEGHIKTVATDGNIIESTRMTTETLDYHKLTYAGQPGALNLKFEQYTWLVQDKAYLLTFISEEDQFDNYQAVGEQILNSFNLTVGNKTQKRIPDSWKSLTENNYSISYPEDWELNNSGLMGTNFILLSPISSGQDRFRENVNLLMEDLTGLNLDLDEYAEISESKIKTLRTDAKIIESKIITTKNLDYHRIIYTGKQGFFNLEFEQYVWVLEDKAYILTFTCEESQFDNYQAVREQILNSFNLTVENKTQTRIPDSWKSFTENNYSISYPEDWELNNSGLMGTNFILLSPISSGQDRLRENVNLLIEDLTGLNLDLDEYAEISEGQIKTMITDAKIIESKIITTKNLDYHRIIYTGKQGFFNLEFEQYVWVLEDKAYILTFTCEESQFDNYQALGEQILNSFSFF